MALTTDATATGALTALASPDSQANSGSVLQARGTAGQDWLQLGKSTGAQDWLRLGPPNSTNANPTNANPYARGDQTSLSCPDDRSGSSDLAQRLRGVYGTQPGSADLSKGTGMNGEQPSQDVARMQTLLRRAGFDVGTFGANGDGVDGRFGDFTERAVQAAQRQLGLDPNGLASGDFLEKLAGMPGRSLSPAAQNRGTQPGHDPGDDGYTPAAEANPSSRNPNWRSTLNSRYDDIIAQAAQRYGVDPMLIKCVIQQESGFSPKSHSYAGAMGVMQLMPGTARSLGVSNPWDPRQSIDGGVRYLAQQLKRFNGSVPLALAAYNAGPGAVLKAGGRVPGIFQTQDYVRKIMANYTRYGGGANTAYV